MDRVETLICGAGIAGVAIAYELAVVRGRPNILIVDPEPPLSVTSDKSTECYRDHWPDPAMRRLMNRSIERMEELDAKTGHRFRLNRNGYLYVAYTDEGAAQLDGPNLSTDVYKFCGEFPYLRPNPKAFLKVERAGWLTAQQLGAYLLEAAREHGARTLRDRAVSINGRQCRLESGQEIQYGHFVNAAGPNFVDVCKFVDQNYNIESEWHRKFAIRHSGVPRNAPLVILSDPVKLDWSEETKIELRNDPRTRPLTETLPSGAHFRPEGDDWLLLLWSIGVEVEEQLHYEATLRTCSRLLPSLESLIERPPKPVIDGGCYVQALDNRPVLGEIVPGFYAMGAFSGYGIMAALGAAEIVANDMLGLGHDLDFSPTRLPGLKPGGNHGQL